NQLARKVRVQVENLERRDAPSANPFTPGDLVVYRTGDGSAAITSAATAIYVAEYTPSGALVQSIALPTVVTGSNNPLTTSGQAPSEGMMLLSANGQKLVLPGYVALPGLAGVASSASTTAAVNISGASNASPIVITSTSAPASAAQVTVAGVGGNT